MARLVGVDLPRNKRLEVALTYIYGIGPTRAKKILEVTGIFKIDLTLFNVFNNSSHDNSSSNDFFPDKL